MLLAQVYLALVSCVSQGKVCSVSDAWIQDNVMLISGQILTNTLLIQRKDGSWEDQSSELTAYGIITLSTLIRLPRLVQLLPELQERISLAQQFLAANFERWGDPCYIWVEKVSFANPTLTKAYCLAALRSNTMNIESWSHNESDKAASRAKLLKTTKFFTALPLLVSTPELQLRAALVEAHQYLPLLNPQQRTVFNLPGKNRDYLEYIPAVWTSCALRRTIHVVPNVLQEMMLVSMFNYQADALMEIWTQQLPPEAIRKAINKAVTDIEISEQTSGPSSSLDVTNGLGCSSDHSKFDSRSPEIMATEETLSRTLKGFVGTIMTRDCVIHSRFSERARLLREISVFLHAHVTQSEDSGQILGHGIKDHAMTNGNGNGKRIPPRKTYFDWVRTTSADHTSCPYSFVFYECLVSYTLQSQKKAFIPTSSTSSSSEASCSPILSTSVRQQYLAQDLCRHLATMCRQNNDHGSVLRDQQEGNLNSVDFPEFIDRCGEVQQKRPQAVLEEATATTTTTTTTTSEAQSGTKMQPQSEENILVPGTSAALNGSQVFHLHQQQQQQQQTEHKETGIPTCSINPHHADQNPPTTTHPYNGNGNGNGFSNGTSSSPSSSTTTAAPANNIIEARKADLLWLAEYERRCLEKTLSESEKELEEEGEEKKEEKQQRASFGLQEHHEEVMEYVRLFVDVTDLYGQIYMARDIGSRQ